MRHAVADRLAAYAAWCDEAPPRATVAAVSACNAVRLPAPVCLSVGALAGVLAAADLAPKRAAALWLARRLDRPC